MATTALVAGCTVTIGKQASTSTPVAQLVDANCLVVTKGVGTAGTFDSGAAPEGLDVAVCAHARQVPDADEAADYYQADVTVIATKSVAVRLTSGVPVLNNVFVPGSGNASLGGPCPQPPAGTDNAVVWRLGRGTTACTLSTKVSPGAGQRFTVAVDGVATTFDVPVG